MLFAYVSCLLLVSTITLFFTEGPSVAGVVFFGGVREWGCRGGEEGTLISTSAAHPLNLTWCQSQRTGGLAGDVVTLYDATSNSH